MGIFGHMNSFPIDAQPFLYGRTDEFVLSEYSGVWDEVTSLFLRHAVTAAKKKAAFTAPAHERPFISFPLIT